MYKRIKLFLIGFISFVVFVPMLSSTAFAWTSTPIPTLGAGGLNSWNWPLLIQNGNDTANITAGNPSNSYPSFNTNTSSYVIGHETLSGVAWDNSGYLTTSNSSATSTVDAWHWTIFISQTATPIKFIKSGSTYQFQSGDSTPLAMIEFWDYGGYTYHYADNQNGLIDNVLSTTTAPFLDGIYAVHNVNYDSSWDQPFLNTVVQYGSNGSSPTTSACSGTDIACYLASIWQGVTGAVANALNDFLTGLSVLFIPNGSYFSTDFSSSTSILTNKLGFLLWPFTFVGSIFTAITSPSGTCCTVGGGGTFLGATVGGIDLTYVAVHINALWIVMQDLARGMLLLILVFGLRRKYLELTSK